MLKKIQPMLILALCGAYPVCSSGAIRSVDEAKIVAAEFFQSGENTRLADKDAFTLVHTATNEAQTPSYYVLNAKDGQGFVIVSADEDAMSVIAYSDVSTWDANAVPGAAGDILKYPIIRQGSSMRRVKRSAGMEKKELTTPIWSQEAPFNNKIPNRRLTGCVGLALAEILKYHSYPESRPASLVGSGETGTYAWGSMRTDNYRYGYSQDEADAVATLVSDAAISIGTDFGMSSSSAFEVKVPYALTSMLGYDAGVSYKKRAEMSREAWDVLIANEINENRPVLYSGQDVSSGHAFVCDGYEKLGNDYFFHINWGWGGAANGYYASDALNPTVSKTHHYNDLMTIVYNIKPATNAIVWSPLHITSDERQVGLTTDVDDISSVASFTVRAGAIKNISNVDFSGKLAVALYDAAGNRKCLLSDERNYTLWTLQITKYVDFSCKVPSVVSVGDGDVVRLVSKTAADEDWCPLAGDLLAPGEILAKGAQLPYFNVSVPAGAEFVEITSGGDKVIKGRDYTFKVVPTSADKVVTVKANGYILSAGANNVYKLTNVIEDQNIDLNVQNAADVLTKSVLWLQAGNLKNMLNDDETSTIKDLTLYGTMNVEDFNFIRERMKIDRLDISQVSILASGSNPANAIPTKAFLNYGSLKSVVLPNNLTTLKNGCFSRTSLTTVEIPASVSTWEYNVFVNCTRLREVIVRRSSPAWINWCVFNGTPRTKLVVPVGASGAYAAKEYWQDFKEIVEENPVPVDQFTVTLQEKSGLKITDVTEGTQFPAGASYSFKVEADENIYGDALMEVYANADRLFADASGAYTTTIKRNTLLHVEFKTPQVMAPDNTWKITGDAGGIGLVSNVVNVPVGQAFNVRVNAIKVPAGYSSKFFAIVLTDKNGGLKEVISTVLNNMIGDGSASNLMYNISCKVKDSTVRPGDQIRLATAVSANANRQWYLVSGENENIIDHLSAVGNPVQYHMVTMPSSTDDYTVEGASSEVVRGMPFTFKVTPKQASYRVTVKVNGEEKATKAAVANITIPAVTEDLTIAVECEEIQGLGAAEEEGWVVVNVSAGNLASKMSQTGWPAKLKLIGSLNANDFQTFVNNLTKIKELDMSEVNVPNNEFPSYAFYNIQANGRPTISRIIMPKNVTLIKTNAFNGCINLVEAVLPPTLTKVGAYAFSSCVKLTKMTIDRAMPPACDFNPFPNQKKTLYVPAGAEAAYRGAANWNKFTVAAMADPKSYYCVTVDNTKVSVYGKDVNLDKVGVGKTKETVWLVLPNCKESSVLAKEEYNKNLRSNVPFKIYDNGVDLFAEKPSIAYDISWIESYKQGGIYKIYFDPDDNREDELFVPQNHTIELYFYYPVTFANVNGTQGVSASIVNLQPNQQWKDIDLWRFGGNGKATMYKEDTDVQFTLSVPEGKTCSDYAVVVEQEIMTKSGPAPEYETQKFEIAHDNGIYTIPSLAGNTKVMISPADYVEEVPEPTLEELAEGSTEEITELALEGEITEEEFEILRENFDAVETLDLSGMENTVIPDSAFCGMEHLHSVTLPATVTEIGSGAFEGCSNIETLNLTGVTSIGEGAFEGCTSLTSIMLPSLGAGQGGEQMRSNRSGEAVSAESFRGLNPNCLIYVGAIDIPNSEHLNIILSVDYSRVAASDINIDANYSFSAPASFNLGSHRISLTADIPASKGNDVDGGWKGLILPFTPDKMEYGVEMPEREGSGITFVTFADENAETLTPQASVVANRPYLAHVCAPYASVPVTFSAVAKQEIGEGEFDVAYTPVPEETVAMGKDFSLYGSFDGEMAIGMSYVLDEDAKTFVRTADEDQMKVMPFGAYLLANDGIARDGIAVGQHAYWVFNPEAADTRLYRSSRIELSTSTNAAAIYYTTDGSDPTADGAARKVYDAPFAMEGDSMNVIAVAEYKGNFSDKVSLAFELKKADINYNLAKNWNWISHNAESPVAVADFATAQTYRILSQTQEVVRDENLGLVGKLKELNPAEAYKVFMKEADATAVNGIAFDPSATMTLRRGWNWIGCPVDEASLLISDLFSGLNAEEGDMIVGLDGFEQADAQGAWAGTLTSLVPGAGYMYYSNSDKEFTYTLAPVDANKKPAAVNTQNNLAGHWVVDNHRYPSVMPVTASLVGVAGGAFDVDGYSIAAFCGDECRGIGVAVNGVMMINVHGVTGDEISFRYIAENDDEIISETTVKFGDAPLGSIAAPYEISSGGTTALSSLTQRGYAIVTENGAISLTGDCSKITSVEVYDMSGARVAYVGGNDNIQIKGLAAGYCIIVVRTADTCTYTKVLVK